MSGFGSGDFVLRASRVLGSFRQLFSDEDEISGEAKEDDFELRPESSRSEAGLAALLGSEEVRAVLGDTNDSVRRVGLSYTSAQFSQDYPSGDSFVPLVLVGCEDGGVARPRMVWTLDNFADLLRRERRLEVAGTDATVSLAEYLSYLASEGVKTDDDPALIFETLVDGEHDCIIDRFSIPPAFWGGKGPRTGCHSPQDHGDLLSAAGDDGLDFGVHRWLIVGPANSGSNLHIDPLGTSAWNMLLLGRKLWVLFPPDVEERDIKGGAEVEGGAGEGGEQWGERGEGGEGGEQGGEKGEGGLNTIGNRKEMEKDKDLCAAGWFSHKLPHLPPRVYCKRRQFVQHAGETVFVPEGWWHAVLNLETTLAVTQNFAHPHSLSKVSAALHEADAKAARRWRRNLGKR